MDQGISEGCCHLVCNLKDHDKVHWGLSMEITDSVCLVLTYFDTVVLYNALQRIFSGERFTSIDREVWDAQKRGARWGFIRQGDEKTGEACIRLCCEPILVAIPYQRMTEVFNDLRNIFLATLCREPTLNNYLPNEASC